MATWQHGRTAPSHYGVARGAASIPERSVNEAQTYPDRSETADRPPKKRLMDQVREAIQVRHYSPLTEKVYASWIRRFIFFFDKRHPNEMGEPEIATFVSYLATRRHVSASTQNQALSALIFLYRHVLHRELDYMRIERAKRPARLPVVLTHPEATAILVRLEGVMWLMASLMYGSGLRVLECCRIRVKDIDFERHEIVVRNGKGEKDRITMLPRKLVDPLQRHLQRVRHQHWADIKRRAGYVELPYALGRKYPNAARQWGWQWVFPATRIYTDRETRERRRHHLDKTVVQRAVRQAVREVGIAKPASCHSLRHSFATRLLELGYDIRTIQELMGHKDVTTTMIYCHVLNKGGRGVRSPLD
ncbi:MAG TPA: integron integrase [Vicinamibacteria bacterium]|nr:integron integrase [Vicinamibacteria bacterium]